MKKALPLLMAFLLLFMGCGSSGGQESADGPASQSVSPVEGKKIAYILNMPSSEIFQLCANQCKETAESLH